MKGDTPIIQFRFNWHQLSLIAGMHFTGACFRLHDGTIAKEQVVAFLKALLEELRTQRQAFAAWASSPCPTPWCP